MQPKFDNFEWKGRLEYPEKIREFLETIDVYALITGMDLAPLTLKEAQLMEKPVIATNVGGNNINALDITWSDGTNSYTDNITGLNIATNNSYTFTHSDQLSMPVPGNANISVSIDLVNNMNDPDIVTSSWKQAS